MTKVPVIPFDPFHDYDIANYIGDHRPLIDNRPLQLWLHYNPSHWFSDIGFTGIPYFVGPILLSHPIY
ncbi:hypothetical protein Sulac_2412 [Sulfobacillus acidophilus DSM 10332]|uniref:Uncharacterized protein n=1 Tax=Sulfobacillus acidophilus (strain ATCC 700253 / DSM 10332 / NAL) TaxID=679936 RepID=G8TVF6_SULAD|nr:hypothetical protein Sulac_2412 [Sulfobacillus acidophilus DSM 10332]